jgi:hypothetical protein
MTPKTAEIYNLQGKTTGKIALPKVFQTPLRPDVIKRAVLAIQSNRLQPQGRDPMAGKRKPLQNHAELVAPLQEFHVLKVEVVEQHLPQAPLKGVSLTHREQKKS